MTLLIQGVKCFYQQKDFIILSHAQASGLGLLQIKVISRMNLSGFFFYFLDESLGL